MGRGLAQTAEQLSCSERTLRRYVSDGLLREERPSGQEVRIPFSEERYLHSHWPLLSGLRRALRTEHDVRLAVLFGSMATGEDEPDSDADLLIRHRSDDLGRTVRLRRRLENALGRRVHLVLFGDAERSPSLLADALLEGRVIIDRDGDWPRLQRRRTRLLREAESEDRAADQAARLAVAAARERAAV